MKEMHKRGAPAGEERISDYFKTEKLDLIVRRGELMAILTQLTKAMQERWYHKLWRWMQKYYIRSATAPVADDEPEAKK